jgi:RNA polymerase sigma factor (sigma-70 family)
MSDESTPERSAWEAMIADHRASLWSYLRRRTPSDAIADEVYASSISRAWEKFSTLRDRSRGRAWLFAVARTALDLHRKAHARHARWIDSDANTECAAAPDEHEDRCHCSLVQLEALPTAYADILRRVDVEGESLSDAAASLAITVNNATVRLSRARAALRERMIAHCGTSSAAQCSACGCDERGCCASHRIDALRATGAPKGTEL